MGPDARISAKMFRDATRNVTYSAALKKMCYVLTTEQFAVVRHDVPAAAVLDPATLETPVGLNANNLIFIDDSAPRGKLGLGVSRLEVSLKESLCMPPTESALHMVRDTAPATMAGGQQIVLASVPRTPPMAPAPSTLRQLEREASSECDLDTSLETMATKVRQAFDSGHLWCVDRMNPHTAQYWVREFVQHVEAAN